MTTNGAVDLEKRQERKSRFRNLLGLAILLAAMAWSVVHVSIQSFGPETDTALVAGKKVIRFAHWQLEGRCVEALNEACRAYEALHPDVAVRQIEVPERAYEQWVRTQLIGRTAPDLIESRGWLDLTVRYFVPLTDVVELPNPYNDGDPNLAGKPWRETYVDNMMGGWNYELRDYYGMPLSVFTIRCYANRELLKKAAGVTQPPKTLGEFMDICERIQAYAKATHQERTLLPIAGSKYTENVFRGRYWQMATWGLLDKYDTDCDGWFSDAERLQAVFTGKLDLTADPCIRAGHRVLYDISRYFNPGFMAAQRDDSVFYFAQANAAMIATGTWDAGSLWREISGSFDIMVFDFPIAGPQEKYGPYLKYRLTEAGDRAGFSLGLTRFSRHKDVAIDFMRFLTSRKQNEELNRKFRWFPAIRGAEPDPILKPFRPQEEGIYGVFNIHFEGDTRLRYDQKYTAYISDVDPEPERHGEFLAAARGNREAFLARYGSLASRFLQRTAGQDDPAARYGYAQYLEEWREEHYRQFIQSYAKDYHELALRDFHRNYVNSYHRAVQAEGAIAANRAKAMTQGMQPKTRRALASVILGQASKVGDRARDLEIYNSVKKLLDQPPAGEGEN